jgi:epoxyqueuosine reductase
MTVLRETFDDVLREFSCCNLAAVPVSELPRREQTYFETFMPEARTAITLAHHITTEEEWKWNVTEAGAERCGADDHAREVCERLRSEIVHSGGKAKLVKYPGESGLQFRFVAQASGLGTIGVNAFLFHPAWGPWVHLRVMATDAELDIRPDIPGRQTCTRCLLCLPECPAGAISEEGFSGQRCRSFRGARGEYEPWGPERELRYCERCIRICPQGRKPWTRDP